MGVVWPRIHCHVESVVDQIEIMWFSCMTRSKLDWICVILGMSRTQDLWQLGGGLEDSKGTTVNHLVAGVLRSKKKIVGGMQKKKRTECVQKKKKLKNRTGSV